MDRARPSAFGDLLRRSREAAGLTQEELAERARVSARTIGDLERGVSRAPHRDTVELLGEALGLSREAQASFEATARRRATPAPAFAGLAVGGPHPPLVGRARELELLARHVGGAGPPLLVLAGEPGIGKSRLLGELARRAASRGRCVLEGGCQRRGSEEPFAPLGRALSGFLRRRAPASRRADLRGCAWLVRLLPELTDTIGEPLPSWALPPDQERRLMFEAVARLLDNLAAQDAPEAGGVVLVLDDLQWAGGDALELITALVRPDGPAGIHGQHRVPRVVGAYRDTEAPPDSVLGVALADWAHAGLVGHHALPPLAPEECGALLDGLLAGMVLDGAGDGGHQALRQRVLQRAGGVPFFVVSYAHAMRRGEVVGGAEGVPWDAAQGIRQRVAALPEPTRAILASAAAVGRESRPELLVAVAGRPEDEVLAGMEAACQARLMLDADHAYRFAHDLVREVVEADLGSARRAAMHRRAAAGIEALYAARLADHYEELAHHYLCGEAWERALEYLALSGDKAARAGAIREALQRYDEALAIGARLGPPARGAALAVAEKRGLVAHDSGDFVAATADFARMGDAAALLGDRRREGLALAYRGMAAYYEHDFTAAERAFRDALAVADEGFDDVRLFATIQLNSLFMITDRHAEAAPLFRAAEELAPRVDDPLSRAWWAVYGSETLHWSGRYAEALAHLERWRGAVQASNQLVVLLWTKWEEGLACGGKGEYARALALLDEVVALCRDSGESFIRAHALNTAGWIHGELQDHERALCLNGESLALAEAIETADPEVANNARLNLGDSLAALGRPAEAEAHFRTVERVVRDPRPQDRWMLWRYAQHLFHSYGDLWLHRGDAARALAYAGECLRGAEASDSPKNIVKARRLRGQAFLAGGRFAAAERELAAALRRAQELGNPPQRWKTWAAQGDLRRAQGDADGAGASYRQALAAIDAVAQGLTDDQLRRTFLDSPEARRIRAAAPATAG